MSRLNHKVSVFIDVGKIFILLHILADGIVILLAQYHCSVLSEVCMTYRIHQHHVGIEIGDSAFLHLQELIVGCKLACLQQALHRSHLLIHSCLELAPWLGISLIRKSRQLNLVQVINSLLVAAFHSEGVVEIMGIEGNVHLVALLEIDYFELLAIIYIGIECIHAVELYCGFAVGERKLVDAHVVNQYHIGQYRILDIKLHRNAISGMHVHCCKQEQKQ